MRTRPRPVRPPTAEERLDAIPERGSAASPTRAPAMGFAVLDGLPCAGRRRIAEASSAAEVPTTSTWSTSGSAGRWPGCPGSAWPTRTPSIRCCAGWCSTATASTRPTSTPARYVHEQYQDQRFPWPADGPQRYAEPRHRPGHRPGPVVRRRHRRRPGRPTDRASSPSRGGPTSTAAPGWPRPTPAAPTRRSCGGSGTGPGDYRSDVAQGSACSRPRPGVRAGLVVPHTAARHRGVLRHDAGHAARVSAAARPDHRNARFDGRGPSSAYEIWRQRIADEFVSLGRC